MSNFRLDFVAFCPQCAVRLLYCVAWANGSSFCVWTFEHIRFKLFAHSSSCKRLRIRTVALGEREGGGQKGRLACIDGAVAIEDDTNTYQSPCAGVPACVCVCVGCCQNVANCLDRQPQPPPPPASVWKYVCVCCTCPKSAPAWHIIEPSMQHIAPHFARAPVAPFLCSLLMLLFLLLLLVLKFDNSIKCALWQKKRSKEKANREKQQQQEQQRRQRSKRQQTRPTARSNSLAE